MLIGIPDTITPELMMAMMKMGHGDELVIGDGNFPGFRVAAETAWREPIYLPGSGVAQLLDAVLSLMPLDYAVETPLIGMAAPKERGPQPIHDHFHRVLEGHGYPTQKFAAIGKPEFYERARSAFAVVVTGEGTRFANVIVRKGVIG